jgi:hypothetical protein
VAILLLHFQEQNKFLSRLVATSSLSDGNLSCAVKYAVSEDRIVAVRFVRMSSS